MEKRSVIKKEAKSVLEGKWAKCMAALGIFFIIELIILLTSNVLHSFIFDFFEKWFNAVVKDIGIIIISIIGFCLTALVMAAYSLGEKKRYYNLVKNGDSNAAESMKFLNVKGFWRSVKVYFAIAVRVFLWALIYGIPVLAITMAYYFFVESGCCEAAEIALILAFYAYFVFYVIAVLNSSQRYFLVPYIASLEPELSINDICKTSVQKMRKKKLKVLTCKFSYILWFVLSALVLPLLFVAPYYNTTLALYAYKINNDQE